MTSNNSGRLPLLPSLWPEIEASLTISSLFSDCTEVFSQHAATVRFFIVLMFHSCSRNHTSLVSRKEIRRFINR